MSRDDTTDFAPGHWLDHWIIAINPDLNERNLEILRDRALKYLSNEAPQVGDYVELPNGEQRRFTYAWPSGIQITSTPGGGSFYLGSGGASYSGSLEPSLPIEHLKNTGNRKVARFWFFSHNEACAHNGIDVYMPVRIWKFEPDAR